MRYIAYLVIFIATMDVPAYSQEGFEIYVAYIGGDEQRGYMVSEPWNITRTPGYDNQPSFVPGQDVVLYSAIRDGVQSDVFAYLLPYGPEVQLTASEESEFSPELMPNGRISAVRVEKNEAQRLWQLKPGKKWARPLFRDIYQIGYYARLGEENYCFFVLPEPFTLQLADGKKSSPVVLDRNIGRSLKPVPGKNSFAFINKQDSSEWVIKEYDPLNKRFDRITSIHPGPEDMAWGPGNNLFMAKGSSIYYFDYKGEEKWYHLFDFGPFGIKDIYRISFSADGNWMAFVVAEN